MKRGFIGSAALCIGASLFAAGTAAYAAPASSGGKTFVVDDDRQQCKHAEFTTIHDAVAAAPPGATIRVCPGTYAGDIQVTKPVTILGPSRGDAEHRAESDDPSRDAIVTNEGTLVFTSAGFNVIASDVRIEGFTIRGITANQTYPAPGIYLRAGANRVIENNVLRTNRLGVYLEGTQGTTDIEHNAFVGNRTSPNPVGNPNGGIFSAGGTLTDVDVVKNYFTGNSTSINMGGPSSDVEISYNEAVDERSSFIVLFNQTNVLVEHNRVLRLRGSGVFISGGSGNGIVVRYNDFLGGGSNNGSGVRAVGGAFTNLLIEHNKLEEFAFSGVSLNGATISEVGHNEVDRNTQNGIFLEDADSNLVTHNRAEANGMDGIRVANVSIGNTIEQNKLEDNVEHDCHDDSVGPGTAGTANLWNQNLGDTENRPGLCEARGNE